ncbi:MAG: hypothetical protein LBJ83_01415 [Oscillospiraceae bacterium]|jgi:hypothetical protein|nr:hypothetical protein [Oscillospiraceae bacterium]
MGIVSSALLAKLNERHKNENAATVTLGPNGELVLKKPEGGKKEKWNAATTAKFVAIATQNLAAGLGSGGGGAGSAVDIALAGANIEMLQRVSDTMEKAAKQKAFSTAQKLIDSSVSFQSPGDADLHVGKVKAVSKQGNTISLLIGDDWIPADRVFGAVSAEAAVSVTPPIVTEYENRAQQLQDDMTFTKEGIDALIAMAEKKQRSNGVRKNLCDRLVEFRATLNDLGGKWNALLAKIDDDMQKTQEGIDLGSEDAKEAGRQKYRLLVIAKNRVNTKLIEFKNDNGIGNLKRKIDAAINHLGQGQNKKTPAEEWKVV